MEDKIIKEFDNFYDDQSLKEYGKKIRTEIIHGLEDFWKRNDAFSLKIIREESNLWSSLMCDIKEERRLVKLIEVYKIFSRIYSQLYYTRNDVNYIKSLVNRE